jgi:hypothetical protein
MRLIYEKGRPIGPDPIGHYVYLWRDGDKDIYVGQGVAYRCRRKPPPNSWMMAPLVTE